MKKVLVLVMSSPDSGKVPDWPGLLKEYVTEEITVEMSGLPDLTFTITGDTARIFDAVKGYELADFDLVVFRTVGRHLELAIAVAAYCRKKGISYIDRYIPVVGENKLSCAFVRWEHDLRVPNTLYGPSDSMRDQAQKGLLGWPLVVKANRGKKGRDNYLVHTVQELEGILAEHSDIMFVAQSFIPNDGDYRLLILNGQLRTAVLRKAKPGSHLNNTSQGGSFEEVPIERVPQEAVALALKATELEHLAVAGADIVIDKSTGLPYILEINRAPQLASGAIKDKKLHYYAAAIEEILRSV